VATIVSSKPEFCDADHCDPFDLHPRFLLNISELLGNNIEYSS
jgi:hypothetical protein